MFQNLGLQLYTIRDFMKDPEFADLAFKTVHDLGYTEVQTAGKPAFDNQLFYDLLKKNGLSIVGTHYDTQKVLYDYEHTVALHRMWHTTNIGIGGMPKEPRTDLAALKTFIDDFNRAAEVYAKEGFKLTYHNHSFEFVRIDGFKTVMDLLYENLDPQNTSFVLDTCWVAGGGADVTDWMEKLAGRIDILHLKDLYLKQEDGKNLPWMAEVGYGNLAWDKIMATAEKIGVKHYVVEQDNAFHGTPFNSLKMSADFLAKYRK
ncbi:MAG: sugar phosphate isomerase/epimerase [Clostridia bacterium]|nr:sugar phosphate isomerase/epimerase [Clostridia bacterium]